MLSGKDSVCDRAEDMWGWVVVHVKTHAYCVKTHKIMYKTLESWRLLYKKAMRICSP
jgi:hypothetical protein